MAREEAGQRGARSIGTQHVLFALLDRQDRDATTALHEGGVKHDSASAALDAIVGVGKKLEPLDPAVVPVSSRVQQIVRDAAGVDDPDARGAVRDRAVLWALLTSDDPAVGQLVVQIVTDPQRVLDALTRLGAEYSRGTGA